MGIVDVAMLKCNSCGGTWHNPIKTGIIYIHACPTEVIDQHAVCDPATGKEITPATFKPHPNPRNEYPKPHPDKPGEFVVTSEGLGVTEID